MHGYQSAQLVVKWPPLLWGDALASEPVRITEPVRFGEDFELDFRAYDLRRSGKSLKLERIPMELLVLLVERRGELVTRDQIIERIWGKDVFLDTDNSINAAIRKIRQVLKDDSERPRFVLTITGKGYRFVAPVEEVSPPAPLPLPAPETRTPAAEDLLGKKVSHYRVLQILGGGGMGVVYKAEDLKLGRPVALKFLPSELASDPVAFERLQREARAASSLDHPNICSIYQLDEHEGQPFIVMQHLEGQTLREWIESAGSKTTAERVKGMTDLAMQIADGLEAAHHKGIIHRDIKPTNIFITSRGQAKILDFGVAKFLDAAEISEVKIPPVPLVTEGEAAPTNPHLTRTGVSVGTPSYLSPEQIRRERIDTRTDLFSFGLVLYEMATGQRAFSGNTATVIRDAVLNLPAVPPRQMNPELPPALERIINKSLEKDPDRRYQTASQLRSDLATVSAGGPTASRRPVRVAAGIAVALLLVVGVLLLGNVGGVRNRFLRREASSESAAAIKPRPSVAVIGFKNLSGRDDEAWISTALSEMLGAELAAGQQLRVVPSEDVARMKLDLSLPVADSYGRETLNKIRSHLSSDVVVGGSYLALGKDAGGRIRIDLQLQDAANGNTIAAISRDGTESQLADLTSQGGASLRQKLGIGDLAPGDAGQAYSALPANTEAARLYAEGLTKLQNFDALAARDLLEKAVAADPRHALSHAALAQSWSALGYDAKAQAEAKKALDLSEHLSREDRLTVEGRYRIFSHDYPAAIEIYRTLYTFFPDRIDYGLHLAVTQGLAGQDKDSLATIARIRKSGIPGASDGAVDLAEARTLQRMSNFAEQQKVAARAAEKGRAQGAPILVAEALLREGWAWDDLGDTERARAKLTEARELSQGRNPSTAVVADLYLGHVAYDKGDYEAALTSYQRSLEGARKTGDQMGMARAIEAIGNVFVEEGKLEEAKRNYEEALRIDREIDSKAGIGAALGNLGNLLERMGDLDGAARTNEQTAQAYRDMANRRGEATALANGGIVLIERGELATAKSKINAAMALQQQIGYKRGVGFSLSSLSEIARAQDHLDEARKTAEQSLTLRQEIGDESNIARSQVQLAQISINQNRADEAVSLASGAVGVFHRLKSTDDEAISDSALAGAKLAQANIKDAQAAAQLALALAETSHNRLVRFTVALASAEVKARMGQRSEAVAALESVLRESRHYGYAEAEFNARLGLGELELHSGKTTAGRARLEQLQSDARSRGFLLIARKAGASLDGQLVPWQ